MLLILIGVLISITIGGCKDGDVFPVDSIPIEFQGRYFNDAEDYDYPLILTVTGEGIIWSRDGEKDHVVKGVEFYYKVLKGSNTYSVIICTKKKENSKDCEDQWELAFGLTSRLLRISTIDKYGDEFTQVFHPIRCL